MNDKISTNSTMKYEPTQAYHKKNDHLQPEKKMYDQISPNSAMHIQTEWY